MRQALEDELGLAAVVIVPGYGDPAYQRGTLGTRTWGAAGLLLKKLESAREMNVLWVGDEVWTWVDARGRRRALSPMTPAMRAQCEATWRADLAAGPEAAKTRAAEDSDGQDDTVARCGLCLLYTSPSPRDLSTSRMPSSA